MVDVQEVTARANNPRAIMAITIFFICFRPNRIGLKNLGNAKIIYFIFKLQKEKYIVNSRKLTL